VDQQDGRGRQVQPDVVAAERHEAEPVRGDEPEQAQHDEQRPDATRRLNGGRVRGPREHGPPPGKLADATRRQ
jgi:hypothetical protein